MTVDRGLDVEVGRGNGKEVVVAVVPRVRRPRGEVFEGVTVGATRGLADASGPVHGGMICFVLRSEDFLLGRLSD